MAKKERADQLGAMQALQKVESKPSADYVRKFIGYR